MGDISGYTTKLNFTL